MREQIRLNREWPVDTELLAQLIEEVSVLAADHRRKKPLQVTRPKHLKGRRPHPDRPENEAHPANGVGPAVATIKRATRITRTVYSKPASDVNATASVR